MFGLTRLITIFFYWIKERNEDKNDSSKSQEWESLSVSRKEPPLKYPYLELSPHKISVNGGRWESGLTTVDTVRFPADYGI